MNIKSKNIICSMIIAILLIFATTVYAANDSFEMSLNVDNSQVKKGENIVVTIMLSDISIESGEKGIGAYTAKLDFDSSVLEYVSTEGTDIWEKPFYQEKLIVGNTSDGKVVNNTRKARNYYF